MDPFKLSDLKIEILRFKVCRLREYRTALQWLAWLRERQPDSLDLLSTVGRTQLVIGHTQAAAETFQAWLCT